MNKKLFFLLGATGLILASCSENDLSTPPGTEGVAQSHFTVNIPNAYKTRAEFGDGLSATQLNIYAYEVTTQDGGSSVYTPSFTAVSEFSQPEEGQGSLTAEVNLDLVIGKTYQLVFFATSEAAVTGDEPVYSVAADGDNGPVLTVNYASMESEANLADAYDCFYGNWNGAVTSSGVSGNVDLVRPVAQVNWGTTELNNSDASSDSGDYYETIFGENGAYIVTNLEVSNVYTTLNLISSEYGGIQNNVEINGFAALSNETYPGNTDEATYTYVAGQYLLAPSTTSANYDFSLDITNDGAGNESGDFTNTIVVTSAPVQANYQTNIYGSLLSSNASYTVVKNATWSEPSNDIDKDKPIVWDGTTVNPTIPSDRTQPILIGTPSELAGLAGMVGVSNSFSGRTIQLTADFDMDGKEFPMIGTANRGAISSTVTGGYFSGVFDGNNHTISNFTVTDNRTSAGGILSGYPPVAFLSGLSGSNAEFKNVIFDNVTIKGNKNESAGIVGLLSNGATVSNVVVRSGSISADEGAGGIVGRAIGTGNITGCENYASISVGNYNGGGIAGVAFRTTSPGITISNCTNYGTVEGTNDGIGGIVGLSAAFVTNCINNGTIGQNSTAQYVGGIVGYMNSSGSIENCTNNGDIYATSMGAGILAFPGGIAYTLKNVFEIKGNTNNGSITSSGQAAGILCQNSATINLSDNVNNAPFIKAGGVAAGIVSTGLKSGAANGGNGYINIGEGNKNTTPESDITGSKTSPDYLGDFWDLQTNQPVKY